MYAFPTTTAIAFAPAMSAASCRRVSTPSEFAACRAVRESVFVAELSVPAAIEFDKHDANPSATVVHYLAAERDDGTDALATCRLRALPGGARKLERFCVAKHARGGGVGSALARFVEEDVALSARGPLHCHAKEGSHLFYERLGWVTEGAPFFESGVMHVAMVKRLSPSGACGRETRVGMSHVCLRTHDIETARKFYSILGFGDESRFIVSDCRAAWIQSPYLGTRIELIEVTPFPRSTLRVADEALHSRDVGVYHISVDATRACLSLKGLLHSWNETSKTTYGKTLRVIVPIMRAVVAGRHVESMMITDADGNLIEVLREIWEDTKEDTGGLDSTGRLVDGQKGLFEWEDDGVSRKDVLEGL